MAEYIEREALVEFMNECKGNDPFNIMATGYAMAFIEKVPSADVVRVVHGEWIITEEILETIKECSCCHCKTYYPKPLSFNVRKSPFCEDCGAKMDGKGD